MTENVTYTKEVDSNRGERGIQEEVIKPVVKVLTDISYLPCHIVTLNASKLWFAVGACTMFAIG